MSVYIPIMHAKKHQEEIQKMKQKYEETLQMLRSEIEELKQGKKQQVG